MTVREKLEAVISSADKDKLKGCTKMMFGSLAMCVGLKMFGEGVAKAERNSIVGLIARETKESLEEETLNKTWED